MAVIRLIALASLAHIGFLSAKRATAKSDHRRVVARNRRYSTNASELVYRAGRWDDMMDYEYVEDYFGYETFVAVDPRAPHATEAWQLVELIGLSHNCCDQAVVGKVLWMLVESVPGCVLSGINKTQEDAVVAYIGRVEVTPPWQNKRVGSTMLPKALNE
ncbi:hypothetical protein FOZ62_016934, partial [Perkinsus olseni]